jgi:ABC-type multidrug transport system ATPase subunit
VLEKMSVASQAMTLDVELFAWENLEPYARYYGAFKRALQE